MAGLRYTAAKTSIISKRSGASANLLKKLLPTQAKYKQDLKKKQSGLQDAPDLKERPAEEPLTVLDYNVELDFQLSRRDDLVTAIHTVLDNQWSELSHLQHRYHSVEIKDGDRLPEALLFLLSGLSMQTKAEIIKYRATQLPHGLVTLNQLYSVFEKLGHTFVDRSLELLVRRAKLKKFVITNALPIILRSPQKFQMGKATYGFENVELVVEMDTFMSTIEASKEAHHAAAECLHRFALYVVANPTKLYVSAGEGDITSADLVQLVDLGFVTLTSNHLNEIESHQYAISYPNCGTFLKLINAGRSWLVKLLSKTKYKEILEDQMYDKWEGASSSGSFSGTPKMTNFRKPYYGYELNWILADCLGAGVVEVFSTPVGRGWRLTGKV